MPTSARRTRHLGPVLRMTGGALAFTALVAVLMLYLAGTFRTKILPVASAAAVEPLPAGTPTAPVEELTLPRTESAVGTVRAVQETAVAGKIMAKVLTLNARAGQQVKAGDVLAQLDALDLTAKLRQAEAAVTSAEAQRDQAKIDVGRLEQLRKSGSASQQELDIATTALKSTQANLDRSQEAVKEAQNVLSWATVRAPIAGTIIDKQVNEGDTVMPGQTLLTLYDPSRMQLVARVRESLAQRLTVGQVLPVILESLDRQCHGTISEIVPEAQAASRTFQVKVTGPCPEGIYSGMFGRIEIPLGDEKVVTIPAAAVQHVGQLTLVEVARDGNLLRRAVQLGRTLGANVEVLAGLRVGEQVVLPKPRG